MLSKSRPKIQISKMSQTLSDQIFDKVNFTDKPLLKGEYENYIFKTCDLSEQNLSDFKFIDCDFFDCNLSLAKLDRTSFREVNFKDCKMIGLQFERCQPFGLAFNFENCQLNHSSFFQLGIRKTKFKNCQLREVDFGEADLLSASFNESDLSQALFQNTNLEKADFREAINYSIDPENNRLKGARFSSSGIAGLLDKYQIRIEN